MGNTQCLMDNTDKYVQFYELSTKTTSRMTYVFADDERACTLNSF